MDIKIEHHKEILGNGVRLVLVPMKGSTSVGISVLVGVGSRYENQENNGISHFLEHLVYKGTKNFPTQVLISERIEGVGGVLNGYTTSQVTNYWAKVTPQNFKESFEVLSDLVLHPLLRRNDVETERGVIIEEIRMKDDNPMDEVMELSQKSLWGSHGLGLTVLGSEKTIGTLKPEVVERYHRRHYNSANLVVCVAGQFRASEVTRSVKSKFKHLPKMVSPTLTPSAYHRGNIIVKDKKTAQAHLAFALPTFPFQSRERYILEVISSILGGGMSSRLFLNVRDKGLAYAVHCFNEFYSDSGGFFTYAGVEKERLPLAIKTILSEFNKLAQVKASQSEIEKAREKIRGPFLFSLEDPIKVAEFFGYQEAAYNNIEAPQYYLDNLYQVQASDITDLSRKIFSPGSLSFAAVSPFSQDKFVRLLA